MERWCPHDRNQPARFLASARITPEPVRVHETWQQDRCLPATRAPRLPRRVALRVVLKRGIERGDLRADRDLELALDVLRGPLSTSC